MSGIFGIIASPCVDITVSKLRALTRDLMREFELHREGDAGLALMNETSISLFRQSATRSTKLLRSAQCRIGFKGLNQPKGEAVIAGVAIIGQTQLSGKGVDLREIQPITTKGIVGIHNGRLIDVEKVWKKFPRLECLSSVDVEVVLALVRFFLDREDTLEQAVQHAFSEISGTATVALLLRERNQVVLATNNGSLYIASPRYHPAFVFASEKRVLESALSKFGHRAKFGGSHISHIPAGMGCAIDVSTIEFNTFSLLCEAEYVARTLPGRFNRDILDLNDRRCERR